jgi:hypothetical protein
MTEQVLKEEEANPYNSKKDWHEVETKPFVSSNSLFFTPDGEAEADPQSVEEEVEQEVSEDKPYKRPNYKKRYDDLKKHYDSRLNEFKTREQELLEEATKNRTEYNTPKSPEELEAFKQEYPDVYEVVETVAHLQSESKAKVLEERLSQLQEREQHLMQQDALKRLADNHPDFEDIKNSDTFQDWTKEQPASIQQWITGNTDDADLASRALDLFKRDVGLDSTPQTTQKTSKNRSNAADMVSTKTTSVEPNTAKVWTEKEINNLSMADFDRFEKEISDAMQQGRIIK